MIRENELINGEAKAQFGRFAVSTGPGTELSIAKKNDFQARVGGE
jgi:hypothetical protein